ncbi:cytochrome P450 [Actinoplanes sp. NPDC049681]|uniref:cytochrome P450 n=1 Tax=Actinoplanes sp. NPDC049681 TaxID=3363905 RepID=UPI0037990DC3
MTHDPVPATAAVGPGHGEGGIPGGRCPHFPLPDLPGIALDPERLALLHDEPLVPVRLAGGQQVLLVTRYADVRTVLADPRFSREAWQGGTLFARKSATLALATSDGPTHARRRRAVQSWFTHRRAEQARPRIAAIADELLDRIEAAGAPVDLVAEFTTPLAYRVTCDLLGIPFGDLDRLLPLVTVMMSAGRFPPDEVAAAQETMYGYVQDRLAERRPDPTTGAAPGGDDLLTALLTAPAETRLSTEEITVFGFGLLMAGGETTASHLAMCTLALLHRPELTAALRRDPTLIPAAVEELLRWVWFVATGGQPHVVTQEVELAGRVLGVDEVVIPLTDAGNRDRDAFPDADEFRPDRAQNAHLGFGHGRHLCLGASHARVELQEGLAAILRRLDGLELAMPESALQWRDQMFIRGVWTLPVRWSGRNHAA